MRKINVLESIQINKVVLPKPSAELGLGLTRDIEVPTNMTMSIVQLILNSN